MTTEDCHRYQAVRGSESAHCCFEASVIDTRIRTPPGTHVEGRIVCECFHLETAQRIAAALNREDRFAYAQA